MSRNAGRAIAASCALGAAAGIGLLIYSVLSAGGGAAAEAMPDAGKFRAGSALGEERAGFSGRPQVLVFATASAPEWPAVSSCLESAEVEARMGSFTGVLVDEAAEPNVESVLRARDGFQVVVRGLGGNLFGGLKRGFTCEDLARLLDEVVASGVRIERSPIYARLIEAAEAIDALESEGKGADAARYVEFLKEFEGADSAAARAAEARLGG